MANRAGHVLAYEFLAIRFKEKRLKNCDLGPEGAKVVNSPKLLKMGVNSPVTTQIYA
jgi:hypothetical protein